MILMIIIIIINVFKKFRNFQQSCPLEYHHKEVPEINRSKRSADNNMATERSYIEPLVVSTTSMIPKTLK
jgi:hypothetical protein